MIRALFIVLLGLFYQCQSQSKIDSEKIIGLSVVAEHQLITKHQAESIPKSPYNWVVYSPFGFTSKNQPKVYFNHPNQWEGERSSGTKKHSNLKRKRL